MAKKFIILGHQNAITYREISPLIKEGKLWLGNNNGGKKWFRVPMHYTNNTPSREKIVDGVKYHSLGNCVWYTNLPHKKRTEEIILSKKYSEKENPKYDNYDAIEVSRVENIPVDYDGEMGVPITFLYKHNPKQFEITRMGRGNDDRYFTIGGRTPYYRIVIKKRKNR